MRVILVAICAGLIAGPAFGQALDGAPLDRQALTSARGELVTGAGLTFGFGARVRTYVDGALSLESTLSLTDKGMVAERAKVNEALTATSGETAAAGGITLPGVNPSDVIVLPGDGGATALLQNLTAEQISNVVINTANNRDLRQEVDLTFILPGFAETQAQSSLQQLRTNIQSALDQALTR